MVNVKKSLIIVLIILNLFLLVSCSEEVVEEEKEEIIIEEIETQEEIIEKEIVEEQAIITSLGEQGFDQWETHINIGDTIVFINENPEQKDMVITFQKDRSRKFFNSDITPYSKEYEYTFSETGDYYFWTLGYGKEAVVIVE